MVGIFGTTFAQISPKQYDECEPEGLLFALRNLEDQIAQASSSPVVRGDYSLSVADAGVTDKVYMINRCEALLDSIVALEGRLATLQGGGPPAPSPFVCGVSTVTYDEYDYTTVEIGSQCWFRENLRADNYRNGNPIPGGLDNTAWSTNTTGAQAIYNDDPANLAIYGRLYNWFAVDNANGLCPTGWHVPTDAEWTVLTTFVGGESVAGIAMKSSASDTPSWNGSNSSGFKGLPSGNRNSGGPYFSAGTDGFYWSSTASGTIEAWNRLLFSANDNIFRYNTSWRYDGFAVRCLKDAPPPP